MTDQSADLDQALKAKVPRLDGLNRELKMIKEEQFPLSSDQINDMSMANNISAIV